MSLKRVWVSWETQRRTVELARKLGCDLHIVDIGGLRRYPVSIFKTLFILRRAHPDLLFVQNPSMILATISCMYKCLRRVNVVVDRHSTFFLHNKNWTLASTIIFKLLNYFTIKSADLTIVTNEYLSMIVKRMKGNPFVLPDMVPELKATRIVPLNGEYNIFLIASFNTDEPIEEVLEAMKKIDRYNIHLYVSGNHRKLKETTRKQAPCNVTFTGFLSEQEFINMLFSVDVVMVLTTADYCMLCGCYEAVSAGKPLITSQKSVLVDYFEGACFVDNTTEGILKGIEEVMDNLGKYQRKTVALREKLMSQWPLLFNNLEELLDRLN